MAAPLDQQVRACLDSTLSPDEGTRRGAEEQLKGLFAHPEGGVSLTRILCDASGLLSQRQISISSAIKYVKCHWYPSAEEYEPPTTQAEAKDAIRPMLLQALSDPERKVRTSAAFAVSTIARFDWPEDFPTLLSSLVQLLHSGDTSAVHGGMRVVLEFVKNELSEDQIVPVIRDLVPALLSVLGNTSHSFLTRADTVAVYRHIITMLSTIKDEHPQAVRQALDSVAGVWFDAFNQLLAIDAAAEVAASWESLALRIQIFRVLLSFQCSFPRYLAPNVLTYIRIGILNLTSLLPTFHSYYISTDTDAPEPPLPAPDATYSTKMDLDDLACSIFEFLEPTIRLPKARDMLVSGAAGDERGTAVMETIISLVLTYTQVTRQQEEEWLEDPNAFVEDEDEDNIVYSLRIVGYDLMGSMIDKWQRPVARILNELAKRRVPESAAASQSGQVDWWKPLESLLGLLGGLSDDLTMVLDEDRDANRPPTLDLPWFFSQVIPGLLSQSEAIFLQGRAFVFASQFAAHLPTASAKEYLGAAVQALSAPSTSVPVKLSAVKTIRNFCRHVDSSIMGPQAGHILSILLPVLNETSNETLYLVMETIQAVVSLDKALLSSEHTTAICEHVYGQWVKHSTDPVLTSIVEELVDALANSHVPAVVSAMVTYFSPKLAHLISSPTNDATVHIPGEAVQLANAMIRPRGGPLEAEYIGTVTVAVMECLQRTDDMDLIQHGMIHLTLVVRKDCEKLIQWHDAEGHNGIARVFSLLGRFLAPTFSESGGMFVGDLIMHLFRKAGSAIAPVLGDLLQAVVNRLGTAIMPSFTQSLIIPFAYLFGTEHTQQTIDLLTSFPPVNVHDGTTQPALDLVLNAWCETAETITGSWNIRVNDLGLSKLFALPSPALHKVIVRGDLIITDANRNKIMTRSRTKATPNEYTRIPFPLKALKLLLKDVQDIGKGKDKSGLDIADDDGDEEWDDDDLLSAPNPADEFAFLSDWLDNGPGEHDAQDDDEDLRADPLAQIDMGQHLTDVLRSCYTSNANGMQEMVGGLTDNEKGILRGILTV